jgi:hypothetical protein
MSRKKLDPHYYVINEIRREGDNRYWKLHWFGQADFNLQNREPLIEATLVPLANPRLEPDKNPPELLLNKSYVFAQAMTVKVGVGQLPLFGIGTFFQRGRPISRPSFTPREFKDVLIDAATVKIIPAWKSRNIGKDSTGKQLWEYLINYDEYRLFGMNLDARCLLVNLSMSEPDGVSKIIIPCVEIIRFHYANSSEMFREVFTGGALGRPNRVFNAGRTEMPDADGFNGYVQLSKFVKDEDAPIIARMAFDPYALAETNHIYNSIGINYRRLNQYLPEARFPFTGTRATFIVHGKVIKSGAEQYFLVFWIERCGGPFPFKKFEFERDNSGIKTDIVDPGRPYVGWPHPPPEPDFKTVTPPAEEEVIRSDVEPSRLKKLVERLRAKNRFIDLDKKSWKKRPKKRSKYQAQPTDEVFIPTGGEHPPMSTAPAGGTKPVTPLSVVTNVHPGGGVDNGPNTLPDSGPEGGTVVERTPAIKGGFPLFGRIVARLNKPAEGMTCEVIEVPSRGRPVRNPVPSMFPTTLLGDRLGFSYMTLANGERRRRLVMVAEGVYHGSRHFYLMEIEPQPPVPKKRQPKPSSKGKKDGPTTFTLLVCYEAEQFGPLDEDDLRGVLAYCASHRGAWLKDEEMPQLSRHKIRHGSKSVTRYVERVMEALAEDRLLP